MSNQAIYIEPHGTTPNVPPRYTVPDHPEICFGIIPAPRDLMVRYSEISIPHTEFGIRESEFGIWKSGKLWREALRGLPHFHSNPVNIGPNPVHRNLHGAVFSH